MSSRDAILGAIRAVRPPAPPLPEPVLARGVEADRAVHFVRTLQEIGGQVVPVQRATLAEAIRERYPDAARVASTSEHFAGSFDLRAVTDPHDLAALDLMVCDGVLGVAENGAVWLPESRMVHRAAPFIAQHLAVVLDPRRIVGDMREAYAELRVDEEGYGVFVAGPSKTADIEQSLVIGAHGPRSLTLFLYAPEPAG